MLIMICFSEIFDHRTRSCITKRNHRNHHHRDFETRRGKNSSQIDELAICSTATKPQAFVCINKKDFKVLHLPELNGFDFLIKLTVSQFLLTQGKQI